MADKLAAACHHCAPKDWRQTPDISGSYELDGAIARCKNGDVPARLHMYCAKGAPGYGPLTAYDGYHNYSGDS